MRPLFYLALAALCLCCESNKPSPKILAGNAFGTTYSVVFYAEEDFDAERGLDSIFHAVNRSVSTYLPQSDISKINAGDSTVAVDQIFEEVFKISEVVYQQSGGYFDPTIGVLRNAYGFGDTAGIKDLSPTVLDSLHKFVGFEKVRLNPNRTVQKLYPEIYFDFNAVAKGYGIDLIGRWLDDKQVNDYLIELGGEILAKGNNLEKNSSWMVGIEAVDSDLEQRSLAARVPLNNAAMASSGNYRKFRIDSTTGKKYVHTINPLTGLAEQSDITSATVIAANCALADAYATAFMAMGLERSKQLLEGMSDVHAYLTYTDGENSSAVYKTAGMEKLLVD